MLLPGVFVLFTYTILPFFGNIMAFENFQPVLGFFKSKWVGLDNFKYMFMLPDTFKIFRNTLVIAVGKIVFNLVMSVFFAVLLYEMAGKRFKKGSADCLLPSAFPFLGYSCHDFQGYPGRKRYHQYGADETGNY